MHIKKIVTCFEKGKKIIPFGHQEKIAICLHYALKYSNVFDLLGFIRCGFIRHSTLVASDTTHSSCFETWHETKSYFWCFHILKIVKQNTHKTESQIFELIRAGNLLDKNYIFTYYKKSTLLKKAAKNSIILFKRKNNPI